MSTGLGQPLISGQSVSAGLVQTADIIQENYLSINQLIYSF